MDFKSLYCFAELIRLQSFSATASALNLTQPTVSKIIQALEEELGVPLCAKKTDAKSGRCSRPQSAKKSIATR